MPRNNMKDKILSTSTQRMKGKLSLYNSHTSRHAKSWTFVRWTYITNASCFTNITDIIYCLMSTFNIHAESSTLLLQAHLLKKA